MSRTAIPLVRSDPQMPLEVLLDKTCWGIAAGSGTGSQVTLHFGDKVKRPRPITNPTLTKDLRESEGAYILYVECDWHICSNGQVICDRDSDNVPRGEMLLGLKKLEGAKIVKIKSSANAELVWLDLQRGSRKLQLALLPSSHVGDEPHDNYTLFTPQEGFTLGSDLKVRRVNRRVISGGNKQSLPKHLAAEDYWLIRVPRDAKGDKAHAWAKLGLIVSTKPTAERAQVRAR